MQAAAGVYMSNKQGGALCALHIPCSSSVGTRRGLMDQSAGQQIPLNISASVTSSSDGSASAAHVLLSLSSDVPKPCASRVRAPPFGCTRRSFRLGFVVRQTPTNLSKLLPSRSCLLTGHRVYPMWIVRDREGCNRDAFMGERLT
jgi:hypothetical protein